MATGWNGIYNDKSMADIVNMLDIVDRTGKPFVAPSALTQRRKTSESLPLKRFLSAHKTIGLSRLIYQTGTASLFWVLMVLYGELRIQKTTLKRLQSLPTVTVQKHSTHRYAWYADGTE